MRGVVSTGLVAAFAKDFARFAYDDDACMSNNRLNGKVNVTANATKRSMLLRLGVRTICNRNIVNHHQYHHGTPLRPPFDPAAPVYIRKYTQRAQHTQARRNHRQTHVNIIL